VLHAFEGIYAAFDNEDTDDIPPKY